MRAADRAAPWRHLVFGLGETGRAACRQLLAAGASISAVYSRSRHVGDDLGVVLGGAPVGLIVQPVAAFEPRPGRADVALFFTTSDLPDLLAEARGCLEAGIRVLTIAEAAADPWSVDPAIAQALDTAARQGGAALLATGMNDAAMTQLPVALAALSHGVSHLGSHTVASLDRLGAATLAGLGIGAPLGAGPEADAAPPYSITATVARAIATCLGHALRTLATDAAPVLATRDHLLPALGRVLAAGQVCGLHEATQAVTETGLVIDVSLTGRVFEPGEREQVQASVIGSPSLTMEVTPTGDGGGFTEATTAIVLNRIGTLMQAPPGLLTFDRVALVAAPPSPRPSPARGEGDTAPTSAGAPLPSRERGWGEGAHATAED